MQLLIQILCDNYAHTRDIYHVFVRSTHLSFAQIDIAPELFQHYNHPNIVQIIAIHSCFLIHLML
jgi:hypothetical protein